jgi:hypothetical protein
LPEASRPTYLVDDHGIIDGRLDKVLERDVLDDAAPDVLPRPHFDSGAVLRLGHLDVPVNFKLAVENT